MNYINLIKSGFLAMTLACMATAFTGCKDDIPSILPTPVN